MIESDRPVIADICVDEKENCFPMIPSGAPHNEMILGPEHGTSLQMGGAKSLTDEGLALV
jgi:acetolactate synthase-1/2/3 large subunit